MDDFDIDPEEIAMFMGMAEEMAEEERERLRIEREMESLDREEDHEYEQDPIHTKHSPKPSKRRSKKDPFMQWVYDICEDKKTLTDSVYGPPKPKKGRKGRPEDYKRFVILGVQVENAHFVSESFFRFIHVAFHYSPKHELDSIVFKCDGNPVVDGREVFGIFNASSRTIVINLRAHFQNAVQIVEHGHTKFSMHAIIWNSMVEVFLHELWHALDTVGDPDLRYPENKDIDDIADGWAKETKTFIAQRENIEPPKLTEDPYFGPRIIKYINRIVAGGKHPGAKQQRKMMVDGVYYCNPQAGFEIKTMKEFYELSFRGLNGDETGHRLNECVKKGMELEAEAFQKEELCELAANEAIEKGYRLQIDYLKSSGDYHKDRVIRPYRFLLKNGYGYIEAFCELRKADRVFRTDCIINITFLS